MASITIRNLDETTKQMLKDIAKNNGRSVESQARYILDCAVKGTVEYHTINLSSAVELIENSSPTTSSQKKPLSLADKIHNIMSVDGFYLDDFELPTRDEYARELNL